MTEINTLTSQLNAKKELSLKVLGAIEYIEQTLNVEKTDEKIEKKQEQEGTKEESPKK